MNIFKCNENLKSYTYPIAKILVCIVIILIFTNSNRFIPIDKTKIFVDIIIRIISVGFVLSSILCIYISAAEMILIHENRTKTNIALGSGAISSKEYSINQVMALVEKNDIIEIEIIVNNNVVEIGSSSDCKNYDSHFFDKLYYINKKEFADIEEFKSSLLLYSINGKIVVISIDGIKSK